MTYDPDILTTAVRETGDIEPAIDAVSAYIRANFNVDAMCELIGMLPEMAVFHSGNVEYVPSVLVRIVDAGIGKPREGTD